MKSIMIEIKHKRATQLQFNGCNNMSLVIRKPDFCICENKDADQLRGNREADQRLCFRNIDSTIPLLPKYEISKSLTIFCGCEARFVSDLVGNPEDRFSHNMAHMLNPQFGIFAWVYSKYCLFALNKTDIVTLQSVSRRNIRVFIFVA